MKTIVLDEPGRFRLMDRAAPLAPAPGEALVRVHRVGVCGSDLHAYRAKQPFFTYPRVTPLTHTSRQSSEGDGASSSPRPASAPCVGLSEVEKDDRYVASLIILSTFSGYARSTAALQHRNFAPVPPSTGPGEK
jgi:hypothetical protein